MACEHRNGPVLSYFSSNIDLWLQRQDTQNLDERNDLRQKLAEKVLFFNLTPSNEHITGTGPCPLMLLNLIELKILILTAGELQIRLNGKIQYPNIITTLNSIHNTNV